MHMRVTSKKAASGKTHNSVFSIMHIYFPYAQVLNWQATREAIESYKLNVLTLLI